MAKKTNCVVRGVPKFRLRADVYGKTKNFYGDSEKDAIKMRDDYIRDHKPKTFITFEDVFLSWLTGVHKTSIAISSYNSYIGLWNKHIKPLNFTQMPFTEVSSMDIQNALNTVSNLNVRNKIYLRMSTFYKYYLKQINRKISENPLETVSIPPVQRIETEKLYLGKKEMAMFMKCFETDFNLFIYVFSAFTGLRQGETLALQVGDIDFENNRISVTKSVKYISIDGVMQHHVKSPKTKNGVRLIPINDELIKPLGKQLAYVKSICLKRGIPYNKKTLLFPNTYGNYKRASHLIVEWHKIQNELDIFSENITFHMLRHTFCSMLCVAGTPLRTAADLMGHSGIDQVATVYAHVDMEYKIDAIGKLANYYKDMSI